jgi:DNA-binding NarL/FixJ family response regulator
MRILLADNQTSVRSAIRLLLEQQPEPNVVEEVVNTQELLEYVRYHCPATLLLDWYLPGLTSEKLLMELRTSCPRLVIVVLNSIPQTRRMALGAGVNEVVSKKDPPECLLAAIKGAPN